MHVRNKKLGISSLYLLLCDFFFLLFLLFFNPSANKKSGIPALNLLLCGLLSLLFCLETKFHSSNSSMLCQMQLPSPQLHLTTMMEQQKSNGADGTWGKSTGKNEKYSDPCSYGHAKLCTDTARWRGCTVDSLRQRDILLNSVSKRDMSSNGLQKSYIAYRDVGSVTKRSQ